MSRFEKVVIVISRVLDKIAAAGVFVMMLLVFYNVVARRLFGKPILGTYEYVGFVFTIIIGLSLANCALKDGHISLNVFVEKLPLGLKNVITFITGTVSLLLIFNAFWYMWEYGFSIIVNGQVSSTTQTPIYPFVFIVALGFLVMAFVILLKIINIIKKGNNR